MEIEEIIDLLPKEKIRRIQIGVDGQIGFQVGKQAIKDRCVVSSIILNLNMSLYFKTLQYDIYIEEDEKIKLWSSFANVPIRIEYEL